MSSKKNIYMKNKEIIMLKGKFGRGLSMLLSTVMIIASVWIGDVGYAKADELPLGQFSAIECSGVNIVYCPDEASVESSSSYESGTVSAVFVDFIIGGDKQLTAGTMSVTGEGAPSDSSYSDWTYMQEEGNKVYHFDLTRGLTYTFSGIVVSDAPDGSGDSGSSDNTPGKLTVASYSDTNGTIQYRESSEDDWTTVPAGGVSDVDAVEVRAVGREPKYTLRETRTEDNVSGWSVSVTGGSENDQVKRDFESHFSGGSQALILGGYSYNLSNIIFEVGRATFRWSYEEGVSGHEDEYVGNGVINITSATYEGEPVTNGGSHDSENYWINDSEFTENGQTWSGGEGAFLPGTEVTITLIPKRNNQLTEFTINDQSNATTALGEVSTFTFTVPSKNFHLGAKFTEKSDEVKSSATGISGGSLGLADNEFENGTAALMVANVTPENTGSFVSKAGEGGYTVDQYIDLKVQNIFYKGNETDYWAESPKTELDSPATISLNASNISGGEVEIIHEHNGTYEVIPATYSNGVVTFETRTFSNFAIVSKGAKQEACSDSTSSSGSSSSTTSGSTDEEAAPATTKSATLGSVAGGTTISSWNDLDKILATKNVAAAKTATEKTAAKAPIVLTLNQANSTVPASTIQALQNSDSLGLHLMMGNGASVTISNGPALKNQGAINLTNKVTQTDNSKTIAFANNTKLMTMGALHMSVPKSVKEAKLYYILNGHKIFLGTFKPINGQVLFPIMQLGTYQLAY